VVNQSATNKNTKINMNVKWGEKLSWLISLGLSVIYFLTFLAAARGQSDETSVLLYGFCVWGNGKELPNKVDGCGEDSSVNSHIIAFAIDVVMALVGCILYKKDQRKEKSVLVYLASVAIILLHGGLHLFLSSDIIYCYNPEIGERLEDIGYVIFAFFSFFLCAIILGFGFGLSKNIFIGSTFFTALVVYVTREVGGGEYILTGLFCIVHPLSSFVGLLTENPQFSKTVGWLFVVATTVGIVELTTCPQFFRSIGGHFYYDLTLHAAILYSLPFFTSKGDKVDKKN